MAARVRRFLRCIWSLKDYRVVQADDPISLMFRHPEHDDGPAED